MIDTAVTLLVGLISLLQQSYATPTIAVHHSHSNDTTMVHFEVCIQHFNAVARYRSMSALLTIDVFDTWCAVSASPASRQSSNSWAICPWTCHVPFSNPQLPNEDLRVQFVRNTGVIHSTFYGSSLHSSRYIDRESTNNVQLYTSFFIGKDDQEKEEQLVIPVDESMAQAAQRFVLDHNLHHQFKLQIEQNLIESMKRKAKRTTYLSTTSREYTSIIIGASEQEITNPLAHGYSTKWLLLSANDLNILDHRQWDYYFEKNSLQTIVAEHVFEHLTFSEALIAFRLCWKYLKTGGTFRLAVPDAHSYHQNKEMTRASDIDWGHRVKYNYQSLTQVLLQARFENSVLLEWHTRRGFLYNRRWNPLQGFIQRSKHFDKRGAVSLIVDAIKGERKGRGDRYDLESRHHPLVVKSAVEELLRQAKHVANNGQVEQRKNILKEAMLLNPFHCATLAYLANCTGNEAIHSIVAMRRENLKHIKQY